MHFAISTHATTHSYRYRLIKQSTLDEYVGDLLNAPNVGRRFDVEEDDRGRQVRVATFQDGVEISQARFQYSGADQLPDGYAYVVHGKTNGFVKFTYADHGSLQRMDYLTLDKQLARYATFEQTSNKVEVRKYNNHDTLRSRELMIFNEHDVLVRKRMADQLGGTKFVETTL